MEQRLKNGAMPEEWSNAEEWSDTIMESAKKLRSTSFVQTRWTSKLCPDGILGFLRVAAMGMAFLAQ